MAGVLGFYDDFVIVNKRVKELDGLRYDDYTVLC